jgi:hypothetical protein
MLEHLHFEVAVPDEANPFDSGGFLFDNDDGKREKNPRSAILPAAKSRKAKPITQNLAVDWLAGRGSRPRLSGNSNSEAATRAVRCCWPAPPSLRLLAG